MVAMIQGRALSVMSSKAVDGRYDTRSCTVSDVQPWWTVDLGAACTVTHVTVTNDASPGN